MRAFLMIGALLLATFGSASASVYNWVSEESEFMIHTERGGFLGRMGHRHEIRVMSFTGSFEWDPANAEAARIDVVIDARSLKVVDNDLGPDDVAKVQSDMETKVLEVEKHPEIRFLSNAVTLRESGRTWALDVSGSLALHGVSQAIVIPMTVAMQDGLLHLKGEATVRQKDYNIKPISVGVGAVTVKNEVKITFDLAGRPALAGTPADSASARP